MKYISIILLFVLMGSCQAQEKEKKLLTYIEEFGDISDTPIYKRITTEASNHTELAESYKYIDSISMYGITYLSNGLKVRGMLVKPKKKGKYPCIILNRGGNRDFGSLKIAHAVTRMGQLAKEGYVVIASQYRGNANGEGQEEFGGEDINDITILPEVLAEIEEADTSRIGMLGWSRGGMMTYIALTKMKQLKAVAVGGAPTDLTIIDRPKMEKLVYAQLIPNYWENKETELKKRSAIHLIDQFPKHIPILMLHGNADWRVKSKESLNLALKLEEYRIPYRLKIFEGGDHGLSEYRTEVNDEVTQWFNKYLKQNQGLPNMEYHGN